MTTRRETLIDHDDKREGGCVCDHFVGNILLRVLLLHRKPSTERRIRPSINYLSYWADEQLILHVLSTRPLRMHVLSNPTK